MAERPGTLPAAEEAAIPDARRIPEATVARLPLYYRALLETADAEIGTVSSERLAELAGVNAAKVRKDLSFLGSYGTRGVGYDVEYLLHEISRELGLTHDWPVAIVGVGNLGQALANYRGFGARGFRVVALFDADPAKVGKRVGDLTIDALDDLPTLAASASVAIGIIATPAHAAQEVADRLVEAGVTSILNFAPTVVTAPPGVSLRKVDLAIELQILSFYQQRRIDGNGARVAPRDADDARAAITGYPVNLVVDGRRCVVVGAGRIAARKIDALLAAGAAVHVVAPDDRRGGARPGPTPVASRVAERGVRRRRPRRCLARHHRHRRSRPSTTRCSTRARPAGIWVNSADDPANCSFTLMSVVRRGDLVVTIGTGGRSPALATWLRRRFERRARARVRDPARHACRRPGKSCGPRGVPARNPIGSRRSIPACSI